MTLEAGQRLGPYEVLSQIGAGGMGEVWRARDTRLERSVAIKVLPEAFAKDEQFRQRFEREARTVSQLNHPHICTLHDVGEEDGRHFLVMELLEGESLAERLTRGPLPLHEVLRFGAQVAKALDAAHRTGITHRDLKPGNVMLTKSGAKLLDFGLAKLGPDAPAAISSMTSLPTEAKPLTEQGTILGTFQYMAPEQLEGQEADARTDIFAFGALLYEMATGKRAFQGASKTSLIAAIVSSQPSPVSSIVPTTPPALDHVIRRCLEKDAEDRWQSAHDVASELLWIGEAGSQAGAPVAVALKRKTRERIAWAAALLGLLAAAVASFALWATREGPREVLRFPVLLPEGQNLVFDQFTSVALSSDGRRQVVVVMGDDGRWQLALKQIDQLDARLLPGTDRARAPFFSPDGEWVAFFTESGLYKVAVAGGPPVVVASGTFGQTRGGTWLSDGTIVFTPQSAEGLQRVPENGGEAEVLTTPDAARNERTHRWPAALPGGRAVLFTSDTSESTEFYDDARIEAVSIATGERKVVIEQSSRAEFLSPGHLVFARGGSLFAVPFDAERLEVQGSPALVLQEVATDAASGAAHFSISSRGSILYVRGDVATSLSQAVRVDHEGNEEDLGVPPGPYFGLSLSPEERRLALVAVGGAGNDVWVADLERGTFSRLTFENSAINPVWSSDGSRIAYAALLPQVARLGLFQRSADGSGDAEILWDDPASVAPRAFSSDDTLLVVDREEAPGTTSDLWVLPLDGSGKPHAFMETPFHEYMATFSPDDRFLAYQSDESGRDEVYVRAFPGPGGRWQVSTEGGTEPRWSGDGRQIFYRDRGRLYAAEIDTRSGFSAGRPKAIADGLASGGNPASYSVSRDGRHVYFVKDLGRGNRVDRVTVLLNWASEVERIAKR